MKKLLILFSFGLALSTNAAKYSEYGTTNVLLDTDKFLISHGTSTNLSITWSNIGLRTLDYLSTNTIGTVTATTLTANTVTGNGSTLTNASGFHFADTNFVQTNIATTALKSTYVTTGTLTNQFYGSNVLNGVLTNAINTGVIPVGKATYTNITGNITIAGFSGVDPNVWQTGNLIATNSTATDYKITFAADCDVATNSFVLGRDVWVTNKSKVIIAFGLNQVLGTNVAAVRFPQR